ncbi:MULTISPECIES: hypothetical protein [unclassified Streptomyces]|uniref:hypothetical protein n=1 Tax=unclassified Streptomyces TaxID=2593676 RepID=UPI00341AFB61
MRDTAGAATYSGGIADVHPGDPHNDLHHTVRAAMQAIRGVHATGDPRKVPDLTIGYTAGECDSDQIQRKLRNEVRPGHAPVHISAVHAVGVTAGSRVKTTWEHLHEVPLGRRD